MICFMTLGLKLTPTKHQKNRYLSIQLVNFSVKSIRKKMAEATEQTEVGRVHELVVQSMRAL